MNAKNVKKLCFTVLVAYVVLAVLLFVVAGDQLRYHDEWTDAVHAASPIGEIVQDTEIRQPFRAEADEILSVSMLLSTYARQNSSQLIVAIEDETGERLAQSILSGTSVMDNEVREIAFFEPVKLTPGRWYSLVLTSPDAVPGNAVTAWSGNTVMASRAEVPLMLTEQQKLRVNGAVQEGLLHYSLRTRTNLWFGQIYWLLVLAVGALASLYSVYLVRAAARNKSTIVLRMIAAFYRYGYLMRQLISRDFKTKYKRSVLGVLWSFLNPLLTMLVQYAVFSTLFKSDIPNFPLYLLTGIVCFNFFNEASTMALQSIVGNASLITKVYVPKYIYPVSRVLSSTINLLLSLLPLLLVMGITRTPLRPAVLLLPFGLICLLIFSIGIGFILSSAMVFFRDTQFLWGVLSMLWMYATPIFYPENIIAEQYLSLYRCNPLYHFIQFVRVILIDGVSPEPKAYALCLLAALLSLAVGAAVFKKNQDKFILHL